MPTETIADLRLWCENCGDTAVRRYCASCTCSVCSLGPANYRTGSQRLCVACYASANGLELCRCRARLGAYYARAPHADYGTATERTCNAYDCLGRYHCVWCSAPAETTGAFTSGDAAMCGTCAENSFNCCYQGDCTPHELCNSCVWVRERRNEAERDDHSEDDDESIYFTQPPKFHEPTRAERKINRSARMMAVEIEVSQVTHNVEIADVVRGWGGSIVEDGSLPSGGIEINTSPAGGDLFLRQVDEICETLEYANADADSHCGLHIHIDCRDHSYNDMRKLMLFYAKIEPALIRTQPFSRVIGGTYARPCGKKYAEALEHATMPKELKKKVSSIVYGKEDGHKTWITRRKRVRDGDKYNDARYNALNVHSWFYRGTVECRLHSGTTNAAKIKAWGLTWAAIVDRAYEMSESQVKALPNEPINILMDTVPVIAREALAKRIDKFGSEYDKNQSRYGASW